MVRSPISLSDCLGWLLRLNGHRRVPEPPAMITAYNIVEKPPQSIYEIAGVGAGFSPSHMELVVKALMPSNTGPG